MNEQDEQRIVAEFSSNYSLRDKDSNPLSSGEAKVLLDERYLCVVPSLGEALLFSYTDVLGISEEAYRIDLFLSSREKLTLYDLGYQYEDFLRTLFRLRNELLLRYLLMNEKLRKPGVGSEFVYFDEAGGESHRGSCELRLYDTALVILPEKGEPHRIPYSDIAAVRQEGYSIALDTELGEKVVFSQMGERLDAFKRNLSEAISEISLKAQSLVKEMLPFEDPTSIMKLAFLMREGRAAKRSDVESISGEFWAQLEKKIEAAGSKEEYNFLSGMAQKDRISIGLKRGLMGELTGDYLWFLIPIYSTDPSEPGNAVAMEAVSEEGDGRATYFFRLSSRRDYPNFKDLDSLHREFDGFIKNVNRCMIEINFRREPVHLSDERLNGPQYTRYRYAVRKLSSLRALRSLFIGRVIHSSPEQWKSDIMDLLKFNVGARDDSVKWERGSE